MPRVSRAGDAGPTLARSAAVAGNREPLLHDARDDGTGVQLQLHRVLRVPRLQQGFAQANIRILAHERVAECVPLLAEGFRRPWPEGRMNAERLPIRADLDAHDLSDGSA